MVNFLGASRNRKLRSVISNASHDSGASLDANPDKELRPNPASRKQLTSPRQWTERNASSKNTFTSKRETSNPPPKRTPSGTRRIASQVQNDSRNPLHDTSKSNSGSDAKNDHPREAPPSRSPKAKPQIDTSIQCEVLGMPLSPKSPNVVASPRGNLKTGDYGSSPTVITPASNALHPENEPKSYRLKKGLNDEKLSSMTSDQATKAKTKTKKKGLFSRFGGGRREKDDRSPPPAESTVSAPKEIVHEIITNDTRRVSMNPIVVTVGGPEVDKVEGNGEKSPKKSSRSISTAKSPQHDKGGDKGISSFVDNLTSFARIPASTLSRSAKKHGSFLLEVFHSDPAAVVSPRAATTPKNSKPTASIPTDLPANSREPQTPRQTLSPVDPTRQQDWIVSVIEAIHRGRHTRFNDQVDYDESMIDSEESDILDGPRVVYMTSADLDDASVSSIEVLFHWMTCTMDRVYPTKDHRGMQVAADDFSQMEDESTEGSLEY